MDLLIRYLLIIPAIVIAVTAHEYTKARVSSRLGDTLPERKGRLTFNPLKHIEPIGALCMLVTGFGWGNPTQTSATYYKDRKWGTVLTYTAPSVINMILGYMFAALAAFFSRYMNSTGTSVTVVTMYMIFLLRQVALINMKMALFNIIPIYPMDGSKVLGAFMSTSNVIKMAQYEKILQFFLVALIFMGVVGSIINPLVNLMLFFM